MHQDADVVRGYIFYRAVFPNGNKIAIFKQFLKITQIKKPDFLVSGFFSILTFFFPLD